jgi:predicted acyltransferase
MSPQPVAIIDPPASKLPVAQRLVSLDAFRGAVMALMVLVNNGGGPVSYRQLEHSAWDGWTVTDVVFPSFLWMVGLAITLSLGKRMAAGVPRATLFGQVLRRSAILFALGLFIYLYPGFEFRTMRIPGVLQRIAVCYLIASAIYLTTRLRGQILWILGLLTTYWVMMTLIPVPGYGPGHLDLAGNFAHYVDGAVFGPHNYQGAGWDPEGLVSTLPSIATALFGVMAGHILRLKRELAEKTTWMFVIGGGLLAAGMICDSWLPINKKLWSDSFSLFMAGLDFVVFAIFLWVIDGVGASKPVIRRLMKPLTIMGMNAIAVYMLSELLAETLDTIGFHGWVFDNFYARIASPANASLLFAISFVGIMYAFAWALYKRGWFWRV